LRLLSVRPVGFGFNESRKQRRRIRITNIISIGSLARTQSRTLCLCLGIVVAGLGTTTTAAAAGGDSGAALRPSLKFVDLGATSLAVRVAAADLGRRSQGTAACCRRRNRSTFPEREYSGLGELRIPSVRFHYRPRLDEPRDGPYRSCGSGASSRSTS
jgi:hypothetical protein